MPSRRLKSEVNEEQLEVQLRPVGALRGALSQWTSLSWVGFDSPVGPAERATFQVRADDEVVAERFAESPDDDVLIYGTSPGVLDAVISEWELAEDDVLDRFDAVASARNEGSAAADVTDKVFAMIERIAAVQMEMAKANESRFAALQAAVAQPSGTRKRVLELSGEGLTVIQIAEQLHVKPQTVQRHFRDGLKAYREGHAETGKVRMRVPAEQIILVSEEATSLYHDIANAKYKMSDLESTGFVPLVFGRDEIAIQKSYDPKSGIVILNEDDE